MTVAFWRKDSKVKRLQKEAKQATQDLDKDMDYLHAAIRKFELSLQTYGRKDR